MTSVLPSCTQILLADDDKDDCLLFKEALEELPISTQLTIVYDGEQLLELLNNNEQLPSLLFLDLNMPRKNGFTCLTEIKQIEKLKKLPVIILSTSFEKDTVTQLFESGAQFYIRKPNEFSQFRNLINQAITLATQADFVQTSRELFVLSNESVINEGR